MQELEIRAARAQDLKGIEAVFKSHKPCYDWKFAKRYYASFFSQPMLHRDDTVFVGLLEGRVVGVIGYLHDWREARGIYWLGWYYVHKEAQGQQVGRQLIDRVISEVKKLGARKLYTDTSSWGFYDRAHHRYRELGFREEATLRDFYEKGEHQVIYGMDLT
ncbi:GNAT family N-acetyltransferase [Nannocystis pusilla]|uniref:GNAT family N-acetyltransferase n=1 Tax=Nannocystis pusilla TaxID=889268 RepID=UPI003BF2B9BF